MHFTTLYHALNTQKYNIFDSNLLTFCILLICEFHYVQKPSPATTKPMYKYHSLLNHRNFIKITLFYSYFSTSSHTVGEYNIGTPKMRNNCCCFPIIDFSILQYKYWTFLYYFLYSYCSFNFAIAI